MGICTKNGTNCRPVPARYNKLSVLYDTHIVRNGLKYEHACPIHTRCIFVKIYISVTVYFTIMCTSQQNIAIAIPAEYNYNAKRRLYGEYWFKLPEEY